ncbi:MAG: GGDEF domain-containing protein [Halothiobacillaceae bacterium]
MIESQSTSLEAARNATLAYLTALFTRRDLQAVSEMLSEHFTGIGTGLGEFAPDRASGLDLYRQDIEAIPDPVAFTLRKLDLKVGQDGATVSLALLDLSAQVGLHRLEMKDLRLSLVWTGLPNRPRVLHLHISLPTQLHGHDEAYPLKEIHLLAEKLETQISDRTKELQDAYEELEHFVTQDEVTGILTRRKLNDLLLQEFRRIRHYPMPLALLAIDLVDFKAINDRFGHLTGDMALRRFAEALGKMIRETDHLGRWGGDEFVIICPQSDQAEAEVIAGRIRNMDLSFQACGQDAWLRVRASVGVSIYRDGDTIDSLFQRADEQMYRDKDRRKGRRGRLPKS